LTIRGNGFPPGPGTLGSARRLLTFFDDPIELYGELRERWGDVVGLSAAGVRMIAIFDLDIVERVLIRDARNFLKGDGLRAARYVLGAGLITADGDTHRRHRKLAAPQFTPRTIGAFADAMAQTTAQELATWPNEGEISASRRAFDISLRIAGVGLFGSDFTDPDERDRMRVATSDLTDGYRTVVAPGGLTLVRSRLTPGARRIARARTEVDRTIRLLVQQRRSEQGVREIRDLLTLLLAARDEDDGSSFSDEELRDEAVTMLLAGHDTTAASLTWTLALLALHPQEQAAARAEVDMLLGGPGAAGRAPGAGDLRALRRVRAVVDESLRLHPAVYSTVRDPIEPIDIGGGTMLRPGTDVIIPIGGIHRDPRHWTDPLEFRPARFLDEAAAAARHRLAYMPFGVGPRICIGSSFALQQLVIVLAEVLRAFELHVAPGFELQPDVGFIRRPDGAVPIQVRRRS